MKSYKNTMDNKWKAWSFIFVSYSKFDFSSSRISWKLLSLQRCTLKWSWFQGQIVYSKEYQHSPRGYFLINKSNKIIITIFCKAKGLYTSKRVGITEEIQNAPRPSYLDRLLYWVIYFMPLNWMIWAKSYIWVCYSARILLFWNYKAFSLYAKEFVVHILNKWFLYYERNNL